MYYYITLKKLNGSFTEAYTVLGMLGFVEGCLLGPKAEDREFVKGMFYHHRVEGSGLRLRLRQAAQQVLLQGPTMPSAEALVKALVSQNWRDVQWSDGWRQKCWRLEAGGWKQSSRRSKVSWAGNTMTPEVKVTGSSAS